MLTLLNKGLSPYNDYITQDQLWLPARHHYALRQRFLTRTITFH
jgi:hypothetical protein